MQLAACAGSGPGQGPGVEVTVGTLGDEAADLLAPYLHHRRTGRPFVVLKLAATLDGGTAAPDGTSQWITGPAARADAHALRAESDAVLVGAGTVRADDPSLTVRDVPAPRLDVLMLPLELYRRAFEPTPADRQVGRHAVERLDKRPELVSGLWLDAMVEMSGTDFVRSRRQHLDRTRDALGQIQSHPGGRDQDHQRQHQKE